MKELFMEETGGVLMKKAKTILIFGKGFGKSFLANCIAASPMYSNKTVSIVNVSNNIDTEKALGQYSEVADLVILTANLHVVGGEFDQEIFVTGGHKFVQPSAAA